MTSQEILLIMVPKGNFIFLKIKCFYSKYLWKFLYERMKEVSKSFGS